MSCGCGNSIRRASCLNCGNPLKKTRSGRAASRRNSGVAMDNQDELMETSVSTGGGGGGGGSWYKCTTMNCSVASLNDHGSSM